MKILQKEYRSKDQNNCNNMFKQWCRDNLIAKEYFCKSWEWLVGKSPKKFASYIPCQDHARFYKTVNNEKVLILQPYCLDADELIKWCEDRGLSVTIKDSSQSWHSVNSTYLVEIRAKGDYK